MAPTEGKREYWNGRIGLFQSEIEEIESYLRDTQNVVTPDGEDISEIMADREVDLIQAKAALRHAKVELMRIEREEEIARIIPQMNEARMLIQQRLRQSDTAEAEEFRETLKRLEARVEELRRDPDISEVD